MRLSRSEGPTRVCQYRAAVRVTVKSRAFLALLTVIGVSGFAHAEPPREVPLLFGGGSIPKKPPVLTDPWLPTGAESATRAERPSGREPAGCSTRAPVCVHRGAGVDEAPATRVLAALESAYARLVWALRL